MRITVVRPAHGRVEQVQSLEMPLTGIAGVKPVHHGQPVRVSVCMQLVGGVASDPASPCSHKAVNTR